MHVIGCVLSCCGWAGGCRHLICAGVWALCVCWRFAPCMSTALCRSAGSFGEFLKDWSCCRRKPPYSLHTLLPPHAPSPLCPLTHKHSEIKSKSLITEKKKKKSPLTLETKKKNTLALQIKQLKLVQIQKKGWFYMNQSHFEYTNMTANILKKYLYLWSLAW